MNRYLENFDNLMAVYLTEPRYYIRDWSGINKLVVFIKILYNGRKDVGSPEMLINKNGNNTNFIKKMGYK